MGAILLLSVLATQAGAPPRSLPADVVAALRKPERFQVLFIDPDPSRLRAERRRRKVDAVGDYVVTRTAKVDRPSRRFAIASALLASLRPNSGSACFDPHCALRIVRRRHTYELVICFTCSRLEVWKDGHVGNMYGLDAKKQTALQGLMESAR